MEAANTTPDRKEFVDYARAYEAAWASLERAELRLFLPDRGHPLYIPILCELVCLDLEFRRATSRSRPLEEYRSDFPELFDDEPSLLAITFEDYRLRLRSDEHPTSSEYESRFGVDVAKWPDLGRQSAGDGFTEGSSAIEDPAWSDSRPGPPADTAAAFRSRRRRPAVTTDVAVGDAAGVAGAHSRSTMVVGEPLASGPAAHGWPVVGSDFLGFRLLAMLGRGSYGQVYLARQRELADRLVVLKIARQLFQEPRTLAQLRHDHIVTIYSFHRSGEFQAVCMPFLGMTTFEDILNDLRMSRSMPDSGIYFVNWGHAGARRRLGAWGALHDELWGPGPRRDHTPLESLSYVDAVVWLAVRLADALAHAHERGIVHRDVKPANVLLTDDGRPMLLDFNLSEDGKGSSNPSDLQIGGTARYIAPEQRTAREKGTWPADERTDLYSFGLVLHELLTSRHPFLPSPRRAGGAVREGAEPWRRPVDVRRRNPAVSPGLEAIVRHCLEPDPARRYRSAGELREDLQCQLDHRPLPHTPDPSRWERANKWVRRHPRLVSAVAVGAVAALVILGMEVTSRVRIIRLARLEAAAAQRQLHDDLKRVEFLLAFDVPNAEAEQREEGKSLARQAVARYRVLESDRWQDRPLVDALAPDQKQTLRDDMGELLLLLAEASAEPNHVDLALRLNDLASGCYPAGAVPRAIWQQRAELAQAAGQTLESGRLRSRAEGVPAQSPRDQYLLLLVDSRRPGQLSRVMPMLREAIRLHQDSFSLRLILGNAYVASEMRTEALEQFDLAGTLLPESHWPHLCRGLVFMEQKKDRPAIAAFDDVIRLRPETEMAYYNRALAKSHIGDLNGAEADVTVLLDRFGPSVRGYLLRAGIRRQLRNREGALRDQEQALKVKPRDERDYTARGLARQPRAPKDALADYDAALAINPRYPSALQNKANVLGETLGRTEEALATIETLISFHPDHVPAIAGRGVLNARLGRREAAHADARDTLRRVAKPYFLYQVAGIYALTSRQNPDDFKEALRLLDSALSQGFGLDLIDKDRDLDAIRDRPEFRRLVEDARARRAKAAGRTTARAGGER